MNIIHIWYLLDLYERCLLLVVRPVASLRDVLEQIFNFTRPIPPGLIVLQE